MSGYLNFFGLIVIAKQGFAPVIQRFNKFNRIMQPGLNLMIPFIEQISYCHNLRETVIDIPSQAAVTKDNVKLKIDAILYYQKVDPYKASYGIENLDFSLISLAQTTMRAEIGKLSFDKTFEEREKLNHSIVSSISPDLAVWGVKCLRYEIRDIDPPPNVLKAMELQAVSERKKRAEILLSEGIRESNINIANGEKMFKILKAEGMAEAKIIQAKATSQAIESIGNQLNKDKSKDAAKLIVAMDYINSYSKLGKENNTTIICSKPEDAKEMTKNVQDILEF